MTSAEDQKRQGLMLLARCIQNPSVWIAERISTGQLADSIQSFFSAKNDDEKPFAEDAFANLLSLVASYQGKPPAEIQKELSHQYVRWATVETNTMFSTNSPSPFKEEQDPLCSYRHLPGQEIIEWYHCCGIKMPERFADRPDSIHMKLEFAVYLQGNISRQPYNPDHQQTYQAFLHRFLLPHINRILAHRCGSEQFPFYYFLCNLIHYHLT